MKKYFFDTSLHLEPVADGWQAQITEDWNIAAPNGGWLMALMTHAMQQDCDGFCEPLVLSAFFHAAPQGGTALIRVKEIVRKKRMRTVGASLYQNGRNMLSVTASFSIPNAFDGFTMQHEPMPVPPLEACPQVTDVPLRFFERVRLFAPADQGGWREGKTGEEPVFTGWFGLQDQRPLDALAAILIADATAPPILRHIGPLGWVPTLQMTTQLRGQPTGTLLAFRAVARYAHNGLTETDVELWNADGTLVALGRQLALIRSS